jgi:hypothetical protein
MIFWTAFYLSIIPNVEEYPVSLPDEQEFLLANEIVTLNRKSYFA